MLLLVVGCEDVTVQSLPVAAIEITPASITLLEGEDVEVSAVLRGPGGEVLGGRQVTWSTSDPDIADLSGEGRLRGHAPGNTQLRAQSDGVTETVPVAVLQGPTIGVEPSTVSLSGRLGADSELQASVQVTNAGNGVLSGLAVEVAGPGGASANWLQAGLSSSTAPSELGLRATLVGLAPGTHQATVQVASPVAGNSPRSVQVTLQVQDAFPSIGLSPASLAFGAIAGSFEPASQAVQVTNVGGGTLDGLQVEVTLLSGTSVDWLSAALDGSRAPTTLALEATARMLPAGTYRARVRVSSGVATPASSEVEVTFNVSAAGVIRDPHVGGSSQAPRLPEPDVGPSVHDGLRCDEDPPEGTE
ncbi:MAG: hypothetical protein EA350_13360 [Gemmatimonadales bacterium]|nr:MAG: hypothetical protein EA350_13360 [Gemmatimonadales bacterium]